MTDNPTRTYNRHKTVDGMGMPLRVSSTAELGAVLRETRTGLKIHAPDLAIIADMSPTTLRRLESGNPTSAVLSLLVLLDELGIELYLSPPPDTAGGSPSGGYCT